MGNKSNIEKSPISKDSFMGSMVVIPQSDEFGTLVKYQSMHVYDNSEESHGETEE